jgi:hypothetical protein
VLDAKKRGQHHAPSALHTNQNDDHHLRPHFAIGSAAGPGGLAHNHMMNLSTGNLALANQNGKSVSTSALQNRPESSVDRWSVVMDLLAQSRQKKEANADELGATSGKRHSKQLDKFKLAARSVGKQQRHHAVGQPAQLDVDQPAHQTVGQTASAGGPPSMGGATGTAAGYQQQQQQQQQQYATESGGAGGPARAPQQGGSGRLLSAGNKQLEAPTQPQPLLVHHTKSLPVGQLPQNVQQQQQAPHQLYDGPQPAIGLGHHALQMQAYGEGPLAAGPTLSNPIPQPQHQHQQAGPVDRHPYQLLDLGFQQIQSTSGK